MSKLQRLANDNRKEREKRRKRKKKEKRSGDTVVAKRRKQGKLEAIIKKRHGVRSARALVEVRLRQNTNGLPRKVVDPLRSCPQE